MYRKLYAFILKRPLQNLLLIGITLRVLILIFYDGVTIFPDSKTYVELSSHITNLDFNNYSGRRTPGFPLLISLAGGSLYLTIIFQQVIGLLNIILIYDFSLNKILNKATAFWITLITSTFMHFIFYEFAILTETLSLFLTILTFWLIQKYNLLNSEGHIKYYIITSIVMGFLYLTRPMFIYFPVIFICFFLIKNYKSGLKKLITPIFIIALFPAISFYTWCSLNKKNIGYFTSSYFIGYNLAQTATSFFEKVPDEDKEIRDIFLKHRSYIEENKTEDYPMTVWYAYPDLREATKLSPHDLSHKLGEISKALFKKYPHLYLRQVLVSWLDFWGTGSTFLVNKEKFKNVVPKYLVYGIWKIIQQYLLILINILFVIFSARRIFQFVKSKFNYFDLDLFLVLIVIGGSVAQALVAYGNNSRFVFPFLPLIVYFVIVNLIELKQKTQI
ncbi:glycosyltransferase family protein [Changchengzhania lutea]|uniref:glycosyltransferase family 39 protein n=1 Tax=Changchengzhania lutea TaxID=2049305 RepID=UPI00115C82F8|nr:glycosyltransferase family 39 protein [Changchengzhania lutea]